jgi:hypothetical protein
VKVVILHWRSPVGDLTTEQFDTEKYKVHTEPGWLKLQSKELGQIIRLIPSDKVCLVEYGEVKDKPRILTPEAAMSSAGMTS